MSKGSVLIPFLVVSATAGVIYAFAGTNAEKKIENLQLVGMKAKIKKSTILQWNLEIEPFFVNPNKTTLTFKRFVGKVYFKGKEFSKIDFEKQVAIPNDGQPHSVPGILTRINAAQAVAALIADKQSGKENTLQVKGIISVDGMTFPVNYEIPIKQA